MADTDLVGEYGTRSYRYLRLAIVIVVVSLVVSVSFERAKVMCWQESISAYYYSPVHALFIGALVTMGVCLIAIKGSTELEDALLNVSGILAPVVAFVPTGRPTTKSMCVSHFLGHVDDNVNASTDSFLRNNLFAFAAGGALAIAVTIVLASIRKKRPLAKFGVETWIGLGLSAALGAAGIIWYEVWGDSFRTHAHAYSAIAMFAVVGVVVAINARESKTTYHIVYLAIASFMAAAAVGVLVARLVDRHWRHSVLWLEVLEIVPFAVFWAVQTAELWDGGVRTKRTP
jgi:hypothetical protein